MFVAPYALALTRHNNIYVILRRRHRQFKNGEAVTFVRHYYNGITRRHKLVDTQGFEPYLPLCKRGAFPIKLAAHKLVRDTGIEPVTSTVSGWHSTAELITH